MNIKPYIQTPFINLADSDAIWDSARKVFKIKSNLNISSDGLLDNHHYCSDWIELPFDSKYIGSTLTIVNTKFPPYSRTPESFASTTLLVTPDSKNKSIGIGGKPKTWSSEDEDPCAVSILGCIIRLMCVGRGFGENKYPYWIVLGWGAYVREEEWQ